MLTLTADTTTADILRPVHAARDALAAAVADDTKDIDTLGRLLGNLAHSDGVALARRTWVHALHHNGTPEDARTAVMRLVLAGPNDEWSGRHNDLRRIHFDGVRTEAQRLIEGRDW